MMDRLIEYLLVIKMNWKPLLLLLIVLLICYQYLFMDVCDISEFLQEHLNSYQLLVALDYYPIRLKLITVPLLLFKENALITVPFFLTALFMWKK